MDLKKVVAPLTTILDDPNIFESTSFQLPLQEEELKPRDIDAGYLYIEDIFVAFSGDGIIFFVDEVYFPQFKQKEDICFKQDKTAVYAAMVCMDFSQE